MLMALYALLLHMLLLLHLLQPIEVTGLPELVPEGAELQACGLVESTIGEAICIKAHAVRKERETMGHPAIGTVRPRQRERQRGGDIDRRGKAIEGQGQKEEQKQTQRGHVSCKWW